MLHYAQLCLINLDLGSSLAILHNVGVAYHKGAGGLPRDVVKAAGWFEKSGQSDDLFILSQIYRSLGEV